MDVPNSYRTERRPVPQYQALPMADDTMVNSSASQPHRSLDHFPISSPSTSHTYARIDSHHQTSRGKFHTEFTEHEISEHETRSDPIIQPRDHSWASFLTGNGFTSWSGHGNLAHSASGVDAGRVGQPQELQSITFLDCLTLGFCLVTCVVTFVTVFHTRAAIKIGQANQLIVVGLCLGLMGICFQRVSKNFLIAFAIQKGTPTLQVLDGIIQMDPFVRHQSTAYRVIISCLFLILPLQGLLYKFAQGGQSLSESSTVSYNMGITGPPGTQNIGQGHALFHNATLPWFSDPGFERTYGYNMYVQSENTTAMLDGLLPESVVGQQKKLKFGDSIQISATVAAVVCELSQPLQPDRTWIQQHFTEGSAISDWQANSNWVYSSDYSYGLMLNNYMDSSQVWMSWWLESNQTFASQAKQYKVSRQQYTGYWTITQQTISLTKAVPLPKSATNQLPNEVISNNTLAILPIFIYDVAEYDYTFRSIGYSRRLNQTKYTTYIHSDASIIASMVWARIVTMHGPETYPTGSSHPLDYPGLQYQQDVTIQESRITLKQEAWLVIVFLFYPVCCTIIIALRLTWLGSAPVSNGFGLISIMAAAHPRDLGLLRGAALSGESSRPVYVQTKTEKTYEDFSTERIRFYFTTTKPDSVVDRTRLKKGPVYE